MPPETQGVVVVDGHRCESSWIANKVTCGRYGADFNVLQDAIDYCNAIGGEWTILLYTGTYREGEITHVGVANITIKGMGLDRTIIAPVGAPATGVIVSGAILTLEGLSITAPDNTRPALRVTGGTCDCVDCDFNQVGAGGNVIEMVAQTLNIYHSNILTGAIDLSTASCILNIYHSNIYAGITTAGAAPIAHAIWIESCYLHYSDIQSLATGATTCTVTNSTYLDQITNAGTGAFYINGTSVSRINQTNVTGTTTVYGGYVWQITRAVGSVIWWLDGTTLKVIPSQTPADTVIQWAVDAADAATGDITILLHAGTYNEGEITPGGGADITIKGMGIERVEIVPTGLPATATIVSGHTLCLEDVVVRAFSNAVPAITVSDGTLTLESCHIHGVGAGDSIAMTDGQVNAYRTTVHMGDIDLSSNDCILNMYYCRIVTDPIDTAGVLVHQITLIECDLNNQNINSAATGATVINVTGCSNVDALAHAGTGAVTIRDSEVASIDLTAAGTVVAYGGYIGAITRAAGSVVWWQDSATILVLPSATITDGMVGYALAAASAAGGLVTIRLRAGRYQEDDLTLIDDVNIIGEEHDICEIFEDSANDIMTAGANVVCILRGFRIFQDGTGTCIDITAATANVHCNTIELESHGTHALNMTAGSFTAHLCDFQDGDIYLATGVCSLTLDYCRIAAASGIDTDVTALAHTISCEYCDFNGSNITIDSTGLGSTVSLILRYCSDIGSLTDASLLGTVMIEYSVLTTATKNGTSSWVSRVSDLFVLSNANATGAINCFAGLVNSITRAIGPIVWYKDGETLRVLPSGDSTDTVIQWAINAAVAGDTISIAEGTYTEALVFDAAADVLTLVGDSKDKVIITQAGGTTVTITDCGAVCFENLTLQGTAMDNDYVIYVNANASAASLTMKGVKISGARTGNSAYGIYTLGTNNVVVILDDVEVVMTGTATTYGVYLICTGGTNTLDMYDSYVSAPTQDLNAADYCTVRANHSTFATGGIYAADDGLIRLRDCSYRAIFRTGTGNIVDESPWLGDMPWHVEKWSWQAALANSQVGARGAPVDGGSGQVHLPVTDGGAASRVAVEATAEVAGTLGTHFTPARTPRFITQISIDNWATAGTNFKMFYGLRETLDDNVPLAAEHHAGFEWDGTNFQAVNADGVKQTTNLTTPTNATHVQLEVIIIGGVQVEFHIDGVLVHTETSNVPTAVLDWQHLEEALGNASATTINGTVRNGGCQECPA